MLPGLRIVALKPLGQPDPLRQASQARPCWLSATCPAGLTPPAAAVRLTQTLASQTHSLALMPKPKKPQKREPEGECTIPTHMPVSVANAVAFGRNEAEAEEIRRFVFHRTEAEKVTHLEKMATEAIHDRQIEGWNVWTDKEQYWVVTNPTNLYAQRRRSQI